MKISPVTTQNKYTKAIYACPATIYDGTHVQSNFVDVRFCSNDIEEILSITVNGVTVAIGYEYVSMLIAETRLAKREGNEPDSLSDLHG